MLRSKIIDEIGELLADETTHITAQSAYRLILAAHQDTLEEIGQVTSRVNAVDDKVKIVQEKVIGMIPWVGAMKWFILTFAGLVVVLIFSMVTHQFTWPFAP